MKNCCGKVQINPMLSAGTQVKLTTCISDAIHVYSEVATVIEPIVAHKHNYIDFIISSVSPQCNSTLAPCLECLRHSIIITMY